MGLNIGDVTAAVAGVATQAATAVTHEGGAVATAVTSGGGGAISAVTSVADVVTSAAVGLATEAVEDVADVVANYAIPKLESFLWDLFSKWINMGIIIAFWAMVYFVASIVGFIALIFMTVCCVCCSIARCHRNRMYRDRSDGGGPLCDKDGRELEPCEAHARYGNTVHPKGIGHLRGWIPRWSETWKPIQYACRHQVRVVLPEMLRFWPFNRWAQSSKEDAEKGSEKQRAGQLGARWLRWRRGKPVKQPEEKNYV